MRTSATRVLLGLGTVGTLAATTFATSAAQADTVWNLGYDTQASTTIKAMNQTTTTTGFTFSSLHLESGELDSTVTLGDFKAPVKVLGIQVGIATIAQEPVGHATGKVDFNTHTITETQQVNLHIKDISLTGHGLINWVGNSCKTSSPVTMNLSGKMGGLFDPIILSGTYTIPNFANCGLLTDTINKQVSGSGNTISLTLTPHGQ